MKKSRIFMAAGTVLLAVTAIFATKANKKFTSIGTAKFIDGITFHIVAPIGAAGLMTTSGTRGQLHAYICTSATANLINGPLVTKTNGAVNVKFNSAF